MNKNNYQTQVFQRNAFQKCRQTTEGQCENQELVPNTQKALDKIYLGSQQHFELFPTRNDAEKIRRIFA